jgi:hypothetical protein
MEREGGSPYSAEKLPSAHQLRSALRCGRLVGEDGVTIAEARESYRLVPNGGLYRSEDLLSGQWLLIESGLLREDAGRLIPCRGMREVANASDRDGCEAILAALVARQIPLWLLAATAEGVVADELIPDDEGKRLDEILDLATRDALLLQLGRTFSDTERAETGAIAEEFVVAACRNQLNDLGAADLADNVRRLSEVSDQLGYDVSAPRLDHSTRRIEVKGTRGEGTVITFFLSRNEAERGRLDRDWSLVACRISVNDGVELVGRVSGADLEPYLPEDLRPDSKWQSVRVQMPESAFTRGLPPA